MPELLVETHRRPNVPGEILVEDFLKPLGFSQTAFAKAIGISYVRLNEIANGKRSVTPDTAMRFARALATSVQFWLNLQMMVDLYDAQHSPAAKKIAKIKPLVKWAPKPRGADQDLRVEPLGANTSCRRPGANRLRALNRMLELGRPEYVRLV